MLHNIGLLSLSLSNPLQHVMYLSGELITVKGGGCENLTVSDGVLTYSGSFNVLRNWRIGSNSFSGRTIEITV